MRGSNAVLLQFPIGVAIGYPRTLVTPSQNLVDYITCNALGVQESFPQVHQGSYCYVKLGLCDSLLGLRRLLRLSSLKLKYRLHRIADAPLQPGVL